MRLYSDELAQTDRRKDYFLATLAHELRNPLSPIGTSIDVLQRQLPDSPQVAKAGEVIKRQVDHLAHLLDDLLDVARITNGKITLQRVDMTLSDAMARVCDQCQPMADKAGHTLRIDLPIERIAVNADPVRLVQIVANVVANACKFSLTPGEIILRAEADENGITICIIDQGVGLAAESLDPIFGMFAQAGEPSLNLGGLGVGLSLARRFTEMHGGTIVASSDGVGLGCQFTVRLPIVVADREARGHPADHARANGAPITSKRVLVVDDNRDAADSLKILLELEGHVVTVAYDGMQAVTEASAQAPDVVLMDLGMPGISGYEAIRQVRAGHLDRQMVLVALTGWGDPDARRRSSEAGFDHHLVKPIDFPKTRKLLGL